jgi:hypothetical protein
MDTSGLRIASATMVCLLGATFTPPADAVGLEIKAFSPNACQAMGPNTTISELTITVSGLYNPGTTNETVMCPLVTDAESAWTDTAGMSARVIVHYKAGSIAGKVYCTAYVGSGVYNMGPIYSLSYNPPNQLPGTRLYFGIDLAESSQSGYTTAPQVNLLCTISPKATLGTIFLREDMTTNVP